MSSRCRNALKNLRTWSSGSAFHNTTLIISNDVIKDIIKIVKSLEYSGLLLKGVSQTIQNEAKEQKQELLSHLLVTLGASLLGNILAGKGMNEDGERIVRAGYGNKKRKRIVRAGYESKTKSKDF